MLFVMVGGVSNVLCWLVLLVVGCISKSLVLLADIVHCWLYW